MTQNNPWLPKRFDEGGIAEVQRKFFDTFINTYSFFAMYANIDQFDPTDAPVPVAERPEIDRWILSRLYTLIERVTDRMEHYDIMPAMRPIAEFMLDDVSNWYVRRNRRRFWKGEYSKDKLAAYQTLYEVLITSAKLCAPFIPFISDEIYRNLRTESDPESVHLCDFPVVSEAQKALQDKALEDRMATAQKVVRMARALRNETRIRVRQPLSELVVSSRNRDTLAAVEQMSDIIKEEINVKHLKVTTKLDALVTRSAKPNFKTLGPRFGKAMKDVAQQIQQLSEEAIDVLESSGELSITLNGSTEKITIDDVEIRETQAGNMAVTREGDMVVGLNTEITPELEKEGIAREFVNRVQNLRKDAGFDVQDRIKIYFDAPEKIAKAIESMSDYIAHETLAKSIINRIPEGAAATTVDLEIDKVRIYLEKL